MQKALLVRFHFFVFGAQIRGIVLITTDGFQKEI